MESNKHQRKIPYSSIQVNHHHKNRLALDNLQSEQKNSQFKYDFTLKANKNNSKEIINGQISEDRLKTPVSKFNIFNSNISKKDEVNFDNFSATNNTNISKEKKIYLYLKNNFQNPITPIKVNYSPRLSFRKREEILGEQSDIDSNDNSNYYSVSIDTTLHQDLRKDNLIKNKNRIQNLRLNIKEEKKISPIKLTNIIVYKKDRDDYVNKMMKASNSYAFKDGNPNSNKEGNNSVEKKLQNKKSPTNKNVKKADSKKKKKSLRDYINKKNKKLKLGEKQKLKNSPQINKEKTNHLKKKEKQIVNITSNKNNKNINENKEKEVNKKELNINSIIKPKKSENKMINQIKKVANTKENNKVFTNEKNNNKMMIRNDEINNKKKKLNKDDNLKNVFDAEIIMDDIKDNINKDKENITKIVENNNIITNTNNMIKFPITTNNIIVEKNENQNIIKNIIIKRDLSNKNNNSIYISKNIANTNKNSSSNIIQNDKNNNTIYISNYCGNNKNTSIHIRKNSENFLNSKINLKNEYENNNFYYYNSSKNNNIANNLFNTDIKTIKDNNKFKNIYYKNENSNNGQLKIDINYGNEKNLISQEFSKPNENEERKIINTNINNINIINREHNDNKLLQKKNNDININNKIKNKKEMINNSQKLKDINGYSNLNPTNKNHSKMIDIKNNKNNIQFKVNKNNRFSRSFINNKENNNIINLKNLNRNNARGILLSKNDQHKNKIINNNSSKNNISINSYNKINLAKLQKNNKKPKKIIIQNVVIENNAVNNNIFFSNNVVAPNTYLINSFQPPFGFSNNEDEQFNNDLDMPKLQQTTEVNRNIIYPITESKIFDYNINNKISTKIEPNANLKKVNNDLNNLHTMNSTMTASRNIIKSPNLLKHSNSDFTSNYMEKLISNDEKSSSKLIVISSSSQENRINVLKGRSKSLLADRPKAKCKICTKLVETHLLLIHINAHPSQVFNWLFLGTFSNACDKEELRRLKIKYVLNCAIECKNQTLPKHIKELHLKIRDIPTFDIIPFFQQANEFINQARADGSVILIHCKLGISRSAAIIIAYLIKYYGFNVNSALKFIKQQRDRINPNKGFIEQLFKYENIVQNMVKKK